MELTRLDGVTSKVQQAQKKNSTTGIIKRERTLSYLHTVAILPPVSKFIDIS